MPETKVAPTAYTKLWGTISTKPDLGAATWEEREKIAAKFADVDFGCDFCKGFCVARRGNASKGFMERPELERKMACCAGCKHRKGYFLTINPEKADEIASHFDSQLGFWREGIGCSLPRELRSKTCLTYQCSTANRKKDLPDWVKEIRNRDEYPPGY